MDFLNKFNLKPSNVLKIAGLTILAIIVIAFAFRMLGSSFNSLLGKSGFNNVSLQGMTPSYDYTESTGLSAGYRQDSIGLSIRNIGSTPGTMPIYRGTGTAGDQAEAFEVTEYAATIETRKLKETCATIVALKAQEEVIFETANEYDHGCNYVFKVQQNTVEEILDIIKKMDPKDLSENTYTIKKLVEDYTSKIDILKNK